MSQPLRCSPFYCFGKLWVLTPFSHRIMADSGEKARFPVC